MHVGFAIGHVDSDPKRRAWVTGIRREVPRARVVPDHKRNVWDTIRRTWIEAGKEPDATHVVAMQDDMMPCDGFLIHLYDAIEARPNDVICYFMARKILLEANQKGHAWIRTPDYVWGGTTLMPRALMYDFLLWEHQNIDPGYMHDDRRLALYCLHNEIPVFVTSPSLVQHVGASDSLLGHRGAVADKRRSPFVAVRGQEIDWNSPPMKMEGTMPTDEWAKARRKVAA